MASDDWRVRIELGDDRAGRLLDRLGLDLGSRARELARELSNNRLAVSHDSDTVFVYASSSAQAEQARQVVEAELEEEGISPELVRVEHWLAEEERWDDDPPSPTWEEEAVEHGYAPWEVRVECPSHQEADALADRLEREGRQVIRRWQYVLVGAASREEADELARSLHGEVEPGGELVWEVMPRNPFAVFGGFGG
jgi:hypothetical protein